MLICLFSFLICHSSPVGGRRGRRSPHDRRPHTDPSPWQWSQQSLKWLKWRRGWGLKKKKETLPWRWKMCKWRMKNAEWRRNLKRLYLKWKKKITKLPSQWEQLYAGQSLGSIMNIFWVFFLDTKTNVCLLWPWSYHLLFLIKLPV